MSTSLLWQIDTQLHDAVQRQLEWDPEIDASRIAVVASEGVVTLTGFVHTYAAKLAAERSVKRVGGVRGFANDLQVALRGTRTDPEIALDAVHALRIHTRVPNTVTVTVRDRSCDARRGRRLDVPEGGGRPGGGASRGGERCLEPD